MPQAVLSSEQGSLNPQQLPEKAVVLNGVNRVAPITTGDVVLQSARSVAVGVMLGIDPAQKDPLTPYLVNVKQTDLQPGKYNVILGEQLAGQLVLMRGDQIRVMAALSPSPVSPRMGVCRASVCYGNWHLRRQQRSRRLPDADQHSGCLASDALSGG